MSATSLAAESLDLGSRIGTVAPGHEADLVPSDGNLLDDVAAARRVVFVMGQEWWYGIRANSIERPAAA